MDRGAVYAIADIHLGLREGGGDAHTDSPAAVVEFLRWLRTLSKGGGESAEEGRSISVLEGQKVASRRLFPASHLILLGDILELWDGENQDILLSTIPVAATLATVDAEKIYVLGNHDNSMKGPVTSHPFGTLNIITEEVYPRPRREGGSGRKTKIYPLEVGDWSLIFIHGHQLDPLFQRPIVGQLWKVLGYVRHAGAALGLYAYLFLLFALTTGLLQGFLWGWSIPGVLLIVFSAFFWVPRIIMDSARRFYRLRSNRYKRAEILRGTKQWWRKIEKRIAKAENLAIIYGHTHLSDWIDVTDESSQRPDATAAEKDLIDFFLESDKRPQAMINISSWVSHAGEHEDEIWTIFYADEEGPPLLLGWDPDRNWPFHIPFPFIRKRRSEIELDKREVRWLKDLGWPADLIDKWRR